MNGRKKIIWTIRIPQLTLQELFFFCSYSVFLFFGILSMSFYYKYFNGTLHKLIILLCILLLVIKEFITIFNGYKHTLKNLIVGAICTVLALFAFRVSDGILQQSVVWLFVFVFSARNISFEKIARVSVLISAFALLLIVFSAYLGLIQNYVLISSNRIRRYMGFRYALHASAIFFNIIALEVYLKKNKITIIELVLLTVINLSIYIITDARLSSYLGFAFLIVALVMKYCPQIIEKRKLLCFLGVFIFIICCTISLYIVINYDSSVNWQSALNTLLGKRLYYGHKSLEQYGVSLLGKKIAWIGYGLDAYGKSSVGTITNIYFYVDCLYIILVQRYGIIFTMLLLGVLTYTMYLIYRQENYYLFIILIFMALHCMIDDLLLYLYFNTFWFAIAHVITKKGNSLGKKQ